MISKFEGLLSPGLRELGFAFKIPDAGQARKPFDFFLAMRQPDAPPVAIAIEGKTARATRFKYDRIAEHQVKALSLFAETDARCAWLAIHWPQVKHAYPVMIPWGVYLWAHKKHPLGLTQEDVDFPHWKLVWDYGPTRKSKYWRIPEGHLIRSIFNDSFSYSTPIS